MNNYLKGLNKQQYEIVTSDLVPLFVVAGAGTGKTKVLTSRIAFLIEHFNIPEHKILAITFTNKAAKEMHHRLLGLLNKEKVKVNFKTFHGFCAQVLREEVHSIEGLDPKFNILDEVDQSKIIDDLLKSEKYQHYYAYYSDFKRTRIMSVINDAKTYNLTIRQFLKSDVNKLGENYIFIPAVLEALDRFYHDYQKALIELNAIDFNDLLNVTYKLFNENQLVLKKWQNRYEAILVDEFQDTNEIQYKIVKLLREKNHNFLLVGDPDQSIYGWRGASSEIGDSISEDFIDLNIKYLTQNYRSKQAILNLANEAIKHNNSRYFKSLISYDLTDLGNKPKWVHFYNTDYQNRFVIEQIKEMVDSKKCSYSDFAILYRTNFSSLTLEKLIKENRIPYEIYGGYKFFLRKEIKDLIAYLKLVDTNDDIAFERIINTPKRSIGESALAEIKQVAQKRNITQFEALNYLDETNLKTNAKNNVNKFKKLIESLRDQQDSLTPSKTLKIIIGQTNYQDFIAEPSKINAVNEFSDFILNYEKEYQQESNELLTINDFIENLALESDIDSNQNIKNKNALKLMTIHSAKGLEFENVFIINMNENIMPSSRAINAFNSKEKIAEERRIAYVAYTRAKKQLWICSHQDREQRTGDQYLPSRFLNEISDDVVDKQDNSKIITKRYDFLTDEDGWYDSKKNSSTLNAWNSTQSEEHDYFISEVIYHKIFGEGIVREINDSTIKVTFKDKKAGTQEILKNHKLISYAKPE
ncbi:ATP-dependent helicase [Mycoplasma sp. E35C]|uniref:ATP-dependent helicase n=1 Tax=Mycoplasma sp. E35C TaxID=2801918 RepID=UPI001CA3F3FC|nr:UvrD-helicase domain-containing protein [Mycoplasma sp. E35C]QZX49462.1 UvrD-helicase domain-containing protein [Mycoplasma sp. E35C]